MIPFKLLLKFTLVMSVVSWGSEVKTIKCVKCGGGNFRNKKYLFQSPELSIHMGWMFAWEKTDCHTGNFTVVNCPTSCITVITEKDFQDHKGYKYDGIMMDCADELIHYSVDLPPDIDFRKYIGDGVFSSIRYFHNITYIFSSKSVETVDHIVKLPIRSMPKSVAPPTFWDTDLFTLSIMVLGILILGTFLGFVARGFCGLLNSCCENEDYPQKVFITYYKEPSIEMESLQAPPSDCSQSINLNDGEKCQELADKLDKMLEKQYLKVSGGEDFEEQLVKKEEPSDETPIFPNPIVGSPV